MYVGAFKTVTPSIPLIVSGEKPQMECTINVLAASKQTMCLTNFGAAELHC